MKALCSPLALALLCAAPALASVTVSAPVNGATVSSPFTLSATASSCSSQAISAMGYSLDDSSNTTIVKSASVSAKVSASTGSHTLHVKSWGVRGASCTASVNIKVSTAPSSTTTNLAVTSPSSGASVGSPFALVATGTLCEGQTVTSLGYSVDGGSTTMVNGTAIKANVSSTAGSHTVHVKAWGNSGGSCASSVGFTVTASSSSGSSGPSIPSNAVVTKAIQNLSVWTATYDTGTSGTASGTTTLVTSPSVSGSSRQFASSYTSYGGERYNARIGTDATSTNFVYDTQLYVAGSAADIANVEMDLNQVMSNGVTVIYGFQCDGWSKTWDYTENAGTLTSTSAHWLHSNQTCDPQSWAVNTWHHVQVEYSRDSSGNVTYQGVWLDGAEQQLNVTVMSAFSLGWGPSLNINFQIDGSTSTSGSSTVYLDNTTIYSW